MRWGEGTSLAPPPGQTDKAAERLHDDSRQQQGRLQVCGFFLLTTVPMEADGPTPTQQPLFPMPEMEMSEFSELNDNELINLMPDFSAGAWEHPDVHHVQVHEALKRKDASKELTDCWGALLTGSDASCTPGFVSGKGHFKNHVRRKADRLWNTCALALLR